MTTFTPVDSASRLWQVTDLLPPEQAQQLVTCEWRSLACSLSSGQEDWARKQVNWDDPTAQQLGQYITQQLPTINQALGAKFTSCYGHFWIDQPGFTIDLHTDGHLSNALQMYWIAPDHTYGTGFYQHKRADTLIHQFTSEPNTGYLMLNHLNPDGSQPLQWHAMLNPVPQGHIRVTSYWHFS